MERGRGAHPHSVIWSLCYPQGRLGRAPARPPLRAEVPPTAGIAQLVRGRGPFFGPSVRHSASSGPLRPGLQCRPTMAPARFQGQALHPSAYTDFEPSLALTEMPPWKSHNCPGHGQFPANP